eukprot:359137-Chlamydomonas_euryale.AAC.3
MHGAGALVPAHNARVHRHMERWTTTASKLSIRSSASCAPEMHRRRFERCHRRTTLCLIWEGPISGRPSLWEGPVSGRPALWKGPFSGKAPYRGRPVSGKALTCQCPLPGKASYLEGPFLLGASWI